MKPDKTQSILVVLLLVALLVTSFFVLQPYLTAIILAAVLAIIFWPLYQHILSVVKFRGLSSLVMIFIVLAVFMLPLTIMGTLVLNETVKTYQSLSIQSGLKADVITQWLIQGVSDSLPITITPVTVNEYMRSLLEWFASNLGSIFSSVARGFLTFLLSLFMLFYFFRDGGKIREFFISHSPLHEPYNTRLLDKIKASVNSVVRGSLIIALIQGVVSGIGFAIFGVPNPALWGGMALLAALVPTLGTSLVLAPTIAYLFIVGNTIPAFGLLIWGLLAVGLIDNTLGPKMMSRGIHIHPLVTFIGVLGGVSFFGPIGFIVGPIIFALLYAVSDIYFEFIKKNSSTS